MFPGAGPFLPVCKTEEIDVAHKVRGLKTMLPYITSPPLLIHFSNRIFMLEPLESIKFYHCEIAFYNKSRYPGLKIRIAAVMCLPAASLFVMRCFRKIKIILYNLNLFMIDGPEYRA